MLALPLYCSPLFDPSLMGLLLYFHLLTVYFLTALQGSRHMKTVLFLTESPLIFHRVAFVTLTAMPPGERTDAADALL